MIVLAVVIAASCGVAVGWWLGRRRPAGGVAGAVGAHLLPDPALDWFRRAHGAVGVWVAELDPDEEGPRAERIVDAELDRFERWLASLEVVPTITALRERGDEVVRRVLAENEGRWEQLSDADRERLEAMAKAIVSRLLHEPTLRMRRAAGGDEAYLYVSALRELFGLDAGMEPEGEARGNVTELRRRESR